MADKPIAKAAHSVLVLHGPNLNLLGTREPEVYGATTLADINAALAERASASGVSLAHFQSNHEGAIVDRIQAAREAGVDLKTGGELALNQANDTQSNTSSSSSGSSRLRGRQPPK